MLCQHVDLTDVTFGIELHVHYGESNHDGVTPKSVYVCKHVYLYNSTRFRMSIINSNTCYCLSSFYTVTVYL